MLEKLSEFMRRDYNLKTIITEDEFVRTYEVICSTSNTSFPLLTLTYNRYRHEFLLTIECKFITQQSTLQALIEALESVREVVKGNASF